MIKIEISDEMKRLHKEYFFRYVIPRLTINKCNEILCRSKYRVLQGKYMDVFQKIIDICCNYAEKIAIGDLQELKCVNRLILKEMRKISVADRSEVKNVLLKLFDYDGFVSKTSADFIIDSIKKRCKREKFDRIVSYRIKKRLKKYGVPYDERNYLSRGEANRKINSYIENNIIMTNYEHSLMKKKHIWTPYVFAFLSQVKVCPYCNRQFITPLIMESGRMRADIDHFLPKSQYPYFSMSLYNMIPCCRSCNSSFKRNKKFHFYDLHPYRDNIGDFFHYILTYDDNLSYIHVELISNDDMNIKRFLKVFPLQYLAQYHNSLGKEFLQKRLCYSERYLESIYKSGLNLYRTKAELEGAVIGYVPEKKDINNQILGKLKRDLAECLGFIPKSGKGRNGVMELIQKWLKLYGNTC